MPARSKAQERWLHTAAGTKAVGGKAKVEEWETKTDYSKLPEKVKKAKKQAKGKGKGKRGRGY